ncbi:catecholate siderophore receptor [Chromobacterium alkanivorans]|uniref:TonB-dependent receptor n=1 Tax=Chromobacterium alkanivorans TaxID=1071719 RepID=UPI002167B88F|nr:TonB-dependent siderophore receptor [Chromobacterium alkanivorans]MCS3803004.1 catecholate siderophore receptor [Chromobacterium alkanivorans]MCS3817886.1 catecholate siderophore receptor [Chromobacterium alkanivorans]MCS3872370.1 catecholate siderophore receptor [Chromobacterium alkanivorans]
MEHLPTPSRGSGIVARKLPAKIGAGMLAAALSPGLAMAADTPTKLETVRVEGETPVRGSLKTESSSIGKLNQKLKDIPQSVTVVSKQLLEDQAVSNLKDALRNVPGITFAAGEGGRTGDQVVIRGFSAFTDTYLDGMRDIGQYNRDTFNLEKVEVLKGASSMLFGRGSTGGVVNQASKTPFAGSLMAGEVGVGSNRFARTTFDINQAFSDTAAMRVNLMATNDGSDRSPAKNQRFGVAPSLAFGLGEPTTVVLSYFHQKEDNVPDYGIPFNANTLTPIDVPRDRFYGLNSDFEKTQTDIATAKVTHRFSDDLVLSNQLRFNRFWRDVSPTAPRISGITPGNPVMDSSRINRSKPMRDGTDWSWNNQTDLVSKFETGSVRHTLLTGVELSKEKSDTSRYALLNTPPSTTVGAPDPGVPVDLSRYRSSNTQFDASNIGLYAMDTLELNPQWKAVLGARFDRFSGDYKIRAGNRDGSVSQDPSRSYDVSRTDNVWSWRGGLIWQPSTAQSYYLSYGTSFNPSGEAYALDKATAKVDPEKNRNIELGAKWDLFDGDASLRAALFRIEKTNERNTDPLDQNTVLLSGKRHTDGVEVEGAGRLTDRWDVFAGLTLMKSRIDKAAPPALGSAGTEGNMPRYTPKATANLWTTYKFTEEVIGGFGLTHVGKRYAHEANTNYLPAYTIANAMLAYETRKYKVQLNVNNLANKTYFDGGYPAHATLGTPREAQLTVSFKY